MAQRPSTPVRVPSSAANHTPATLDPDMRSQINAVLLRDGHVAKIHDALLHALHANPANWPTAIQSHALALLRSGEITTFPALLRRVLDDIRQDSSALAPSYSATSASSYAASSASAASSPSSTTNSSLRATANGGDPLKKLPGGAAAAAAPGASANGTNASAPSDRQSLAVPGPVVEEALNVTRACLEAVCEIDDQA